ncbi:MAG: amino acid adenylation domain-containing protein, partial [Gammaproteobacteria bacterium]|nr:amino acid adenylation domain-containing protein [Gammaproteobacteria bacterium]
VIYTSGSTGTPKGVEIPHRAINRLVRNTDYYQVDATDRVAQASNVSFDAATFEIWGALLNGAQLVGIDKAVLLNSKSLAAFLQEQGISAMFLTTALFNQIAREVPGAFKGLRGLMFGGEAVDPDAVRQVLTNQPPERLLHVYGPTESTTFASWYQVEDVPADASTVPIGRPLANTTLYVLDKNMNPVPVGVPGELYIGGDGLARGYLNRPELTAEKFVPDPLHPQSTLYRTGDKVRYRRDGAIEYLGRFDHQVKLRGFRVELGEIESVLLRQRMVSDAVVVVHEDESGDKRLVAYVVADSSDAPSEADLRDFVAKRLPNYMVPSAFMMLDKLPLTANGKVDRKALPVPGDMRASLGAEYTAPRTELEQRLAQIWAGVLKLERVGVHDNFFDLGGHSLMATQVVSRIRGQLNVELPLSEMFGYPTVAELAPVLESLLGESGGGEADVIPVVERSGDLPLSFAQERLWFLDQLEPGSTVYNMPLAIRLKGDLSVAGLMNSLNTIIRRQEGLRTRFAMHQGKPIQIIEDVGIELAQDDFSALPPETVESEVKARVDAEGLRPFDLSTGPLLRGRLLRLSDQEHVLLLTMHHIISDGWSLGVLFRELGACYAAFGEGEQPVLAELPIQYADFAVWQRDWLSGEQLEIQLAYWREKLEGLSTLNLPTDRSRPAIQTYAGAYETLRLDVELSKQLTSLSKQAGVTLFMTLLGAFVVLMHRYSGQDDVVIGSPIANRNRSELEDLIGFFINMLVLRLDLTGNPGFRELLGQVQETALGAYQHQDIPFEKLVEILQPTRDRSRNPLFQVQFALQNAPMKALELKGLTLEPVNSEVQVTHFDLECHVWPRGTELDVVIVYNTDLYDATRIQRILRHYRNLLQSVVAEPDRRIAELALLGAEEQQQFIDWNQTAADYPRDKTVHELFEHQAAANPDAIAVEYEGNTLSYQQLNERANRLAHYLRHQGVGAEVMVGLYMEHSLEMIVGLLGILKAGGAYVPLDLDYPQPRITFMLEDAGVPVLLSLSSLSEQLPDFAGELVCLDSDWARIEKESADNPAPSATADNLAYVIYTSGSTGTPKGVEIPHRAINRLVRNTDYYQVDATDRV